MKKLSNITESVWNDIRRRGIGTDVKREDDVNHLNRNEFYEYLKSKYDKLSHMISEDPSEIHIKFGWSYYPKHDYTIDIHWVEKNNIKNLYLNGLHVYGGKDELYNLCKQNFKTGTENDNISNKEIIDIIEFILDYISTHKNIESPMFESVWNDIRRRGIGADIKQEDGRKVTTCLGVDITLKQADCDYDGLIRDIVVGKNEYEFGIHDRKYMYEVVKLTPDEMINVRKCEAPYDYLIYDGLNGTDLYACFSSYDELLEFQLDDEFQDKYCEEDYISICGCIATKLKEIGDCFVWVPSRKPMMLDYGKRKDEDSYSYRDRIDTSKYESDYMLELISEEDVYYWTSSHPYEEGDDLLSFKEDIIDKFPELDDMDFVHWNYHNNNGYFIAIPAYNINNILNIRKYREFAKKWFKA